MKNLVSSAIVHIERLVNEHYAEKSILEIWTKRETVHDHHGQGRGIAKNYAHEVFKKIKSKHPVIKLYSPKWVENPRNFEETRFWEVYQILFLTRGVKLEDLKETCKGLEVDLAGNRIGDIDIYLPNGEKISRKPKL
jgi:hypothetical protein